MSIYLESGSIYASDDLPATWIGFMYEPKHNQSVAWAAYRTSDYKQTGKVAFNERLINLGNMFYNNQFHVGVTGYYFFYMSNGAAINHNCQFPELNIGAFRYNLNIAGYETLGQPYILQLQKGTVLYMYAYNTDSSSTGPFYS